MTTEINTENKDIESVIWEINDFSDEYIKANAQRVYAKDLGLDTRIGKPYVGQNFIAVHINGETQRLIEYYGGFEYIDEDDIRYFGNYKVYLNSSDRVRECFRSLKEKEEN